MEIEKSSPLELVKFLRLEMNHINPQLPITTAILALELASLKLVGDDPTWFGTSDIPNKRRDVRIDMWPPNLASQSCFTFCNARVFFVS